MLRCVRPYQPSELLCNVLSWTSQTSTINYKRNETKSK